MEVGLISLLKVCVFPLELDARGRTASMMQASRDPGCQGNAKVDYIKDKGEGRPEADKLFMLELSLCFLEIIYPCNCIIMIYIYIFIYLIVFYGYFCKGPSKNIRMNGAQCSNRAVPFLSARLENLIIHGTLGRLLNKFYLSIRE